MTPESKLLVNQAGDPIDPTGGFETEYGQKCTVHRSESIGAARLNPGYLLALAHGAVTPNVYCEDGSRRYIDVGDHPEYCTAEDIVALHAAYRVLTGHIAMADDFSRGAAVTESRMAADDDPGTVAVSLIANTTDDYGNSWARHMNILAPRALMPADYIPALVAHRASRIVWSGAGHVLQRGNSGFQYCLSEKAEFIEEEYGEETTQNRPLVNSRDEPLSDSDLYRRIHDVAGESVFSPRVMALQLASEALILKACGLGEKFDDLKPVWGPHAIQTISRDPSLHAVVELDGGLRYTGVQLQHEIASRAISAVERAKLMTHQDKVYKTIWLAILDDLEHGRFTDKNGKHQFDWVPKRRRIDAGLRSATRKHSDYVTAAMMSREYHQILPKEGTGMKLVRAGGFVDAPKKEVLEQGPGLPPTRGGLRGQAIGRLEHKRVPYIVNWDHLKVDDGANGSQPTVILKDPFAAEDGRVEKVLRSVAA